jgi:hypothetical protein
MGYDLPDNYVPLSNPVNVYDVSLNVPVAANLWANRVTESRTLPIGILRRVQIAFPLGCLNYVRANIYQAGVQLFPINSTGVDGDHYFSWNDYIYDFDTFQIIDAASTIFDVYGWNDGTDIYYDHTIRVYFYVEEIDIP